MNSHGGPVLAGFLALGYLLGAIPFGFLLTRAAGLGDIRRLGSGNIGATNVLRTGRRVLAAATLLLDALKGVAAVLLADFLAQDALAGAVAGLGAVLGHLFPVWLGFRGGKGVATGLGVLLGAVWPLGLLACAIWAIVASVLRLSSAAALAAFAAAPLAAALFHAPGWTIYSLIIAVLVIARHRENIRRLLAGTEPRIGAGR